MIRKVEKILMLSVFLVMGVCAMAQDGTYGAYSPYSIYGVGDLSKQGTAFNKSMGGVGIATRNRRFINIMNPAAVTARDTLSFMADFGLVQKNTLYSQGSLRSAKNTFNIYDFVMSFPIWKSSAFIAPHLLSGGQKQRIAIAGVIAMEPRCIVLDEPTAMLDPKGRREVMETVARLNKEKGITVVLITHHMDEAAKADRVVVIHRGVLRADGAPKDVFSNIEYMHELGLAAPETVELCSELNKLGYELPLDLLDTEDCARAIYKALGGN